MSAVRAACLQTGASVRVWSQPGRGTRFEFSWPAIDLLGASAVELGDQPHDVQAEAEVWLAAAIAGAHRHHGLEKLARHRLGQSRAAIGDGEYCVGAARFEATYEPGGPWFRPERGTLEYFLTERYCLYTMWHGLYVAKGTPVETIAALNGALRKALSDPALLEKLKQLGTLPFPDAELTPEAHARLFAADAEPLARFVFVAMP